MKEVPQCPIEGLFSSWPPKLVSKMAQDDDDDSMKASVKSFLRIMLFTLMRCASSALNF